MFVILCQIYVYHILPVMSHVLGVFGRGIECCCLFLQSIVRHEPCPPLPTQSISLQWAQNCCQEWMSYGQVGGRQTHIVTNQLIQPLTGIDFFLDLIASNLMGQRLFCFNLECTKETAMLSLVHIRREIELNNSHSIFDSTTNFPNLEDWLILLKKKIGSVNFCDFT